MQLRRFLNIVVLIASVFMMQACGNDDETLLTSNIDPSGHLSRQDYLDLRRRGPKSIPPDQAVQDQIAGGNFSDAPPIPEMPSVTIAPSLSNVGDQKLVSITVTDNVPLRDVLIELAREANVAAKIAGFRVKLPSLAGGRTNLKDTTTEKTTRMIWIE